MDKEKIIGIVGLFSIFVVMVIFTSSLNPFRPNITPVNGEPTIKRQTFYLGDKIYSISLNSYYFHGFHIEGYSRINCIVIGHYSWRGDDGGMSNMFIWETKTFRIKNRIFTVVDRGNDYITLEW